MVVQASRLPRAAEMAARQMSTPSICRAAIRIFGFSLKLSHARNEDKMKRANVIRSGAITLTVVLVCGTWALVQAQPGPAGKKSSDATVEFRNFPATSSSAQQPRGASSDNVMLQMRMGGMIGLANDDPEMAKLSEAEAELAHASEELLSQYAAAKPDEQKRLKADLRETLAKQFDIERQRRELELARVQERIDKVREQLKKRNEARETIVDRRLDQLINDAEGLGWTAPVGASPRGAGSDLYRNDFQNRPAATPPRKH
jgi:hypothetical protein